MTAIRWRDRLPLELRREILKEILIYRTDDCDRDSQYGLSSSEIRASGPLHPTRHPVYKSVVELRRVCSDFRDDIDGFYGDLTLNATLRITFRYSNNTGYSRVMCTAWKELPLCHPSKSINIRIDIVVDHYIICTCRLGTILQFVRMNFFPNVYTSMFLSLPWRSPVLEAIPIEVLGKIEIHVQVPQEEWLHTQPQDPFWRCDIDWPAVKTLKINGVLQQPLQTGERYQGRQTTRTA